MSRRARWIGRPAFADRPSRLRRFQICAASGSAVLPVLPGHHVVISGIRGGDRPLAAAGDAAGKLAALQRVDLLVLALLVGAIGLPARLRKGLSSNARADDQGRGQRQRLDPALRVPPVIISMMCHIGLLPKLDASCE